jgi:hypothetical protein
VEYLTARVRNQPESEQRQAAYLDALAAHCPLDKVVQGRFQEKTHECWSCGGRWVSYEEKETDGSLRTATCAPAVRSLKRVNPGKRVIAVFPPRRHSEDLRKAADGMIKINDVSIRNSQLPPTVVNATGITLIRPKYWT